MDIASDQLYREPKFSGLVRELVVRTLRENAECYVEFVSGISYEGYCSRMLSTSEWGDHLTLQAAADRYQVRINLITSYEDSPYLEIIPNSVAQTQSIVRSLWLSFFAEVHYNSLYPICDLDERLAIDSKLEHCSVS